MPVSYRNFDGIINVLSDSNQKALGTSSFTADDVPVLIDLNENYLVNKLIGTGPEFDNPLAWEKVVVTYSPPSGTQYKHFTFRLRDSVFKSYASWDTAATTGTWTLKDAVVVSANGALKKLDSSNFTSNDNITVS